jgi:hypothetical protein
LTGQTTYDYSRQISKVDLSQLWIEQRLLVIDDHGKEQLIQRPEPLGFIGENYQRFYIHFIMVHRSPTNYLQYLVTGKTRVRNSVCDFKGTITIREAHLESDPDVPEYKTGYIVGEYRLEEDRQQKGSGYFKGKFRSNWFIARDGKIRYNTLKMIADDFCNNQFIGSWTSYATGKGEKCNWGDYRIPDSDDLDCGAAEFAVTERYIKNGWESYMQAFMTNPALPQSKRAQTIEATKWWQ